MHNSLVEWRIDRTHVNSFLSADLTCPKATEKNQKE